MEKKEHQKERGWLLREKYNGIETPEFFDDLKRVEEGEPVDYVIGFSDFLGAKIDLGMKPLIPRVDTEHWVEKAIEEIKKSEKKTPKILDIFSGSGCIGIAVLKKIREANVDFTEKDPILVEQIKKNLDINKISFEQADIFESDVFQNVPAKKYDYIFANPPYIAEERKWQVGSSVLDHEPHLALFADDDGLFFIKKLLAEAPGFLVPGGKIWIEFDSWQKEKIEKILPDYEYSDFEFQKDQFEKWRAVAITL